MLLLQIKVTPQNTKDLIFVLTKYFCPIHFFGLVYFVVINKFCSVLFKYSGKYMFSKLPVLYPKPEQEISIYINKRVVQILMSKHCISSDPNPTHLTIRRKTKRKQWEPQKMNDRLHQHKAWALILKPASNRA